MRADIRTASYEDAKNKTFEVIQVIENLCEFCRKAVNTEEKKVRELTISSKKDFEDLLTRSTAHDTVEIDIEGKRIYLLDRRYPVVFHASCLKTA
ncbi:MAG: hypothetical protein ACE5PO_00355 [Candidatus Bathyarchaeia archaeon]